MLSMVGESSFGNLGPAFKAPKLMRPTVKACVQAYMEWRGWLD